MNSDYYLQQINNKLNNTNNMLDNIIDNQEIIITKQEQLISGDILIETEIQTSNTILVAILFILTLTLLHTFISRCFRC